MRARLSRAGETLLRHWSLVIDLRRECNSQSCLKLIALARWLAEPQKVSNQGRVRASPPALR